MTKICQRCFLEQSVDLFKRKTNTKLYSYCKPCRSVMRHEQWEKNKNKEKANNIAWRKAHPETTAVYSRRHKKNNPNRARQDRNCKLKRVYGISSIDYEQMKQAQQNRCAICNRSTDTTLHIDHDHESTKVRGLLCGECNRGLGMFKDSPELLKTAASYLENNSCVS